LCLEVPVFLLPAKYYCSDRHLHGEGLYKYDNVPLYQKYGKQNGNYLS
jgi:hypothetical protein